MRKGLVFDINEFAVHDGPGIRTSVFLKGCPLRCEWCHNPEGQSFNQELLVGDNGCIRCGKCKAVCKHETCIVCGECITVCPRNLRRFAAVEWESEALAEKLLKNRTFYENYGGGVTFSGGEPLAQHEFLFEVMQNLKPVHVAIETAGHVSPEIFNKALKFADLIIMDIKHMNSDLHRRYTGFGNEIILSNLKVLLKSDKPCILRIPVIPGYNDTYENMEQTARLISGHKNVIRLELLTYHKTAGAKYPLLGRKYPFRQLKDTEDPESFSMVFEGCIL
jgi:pyruvate formate lyase activating enzyme